MNHTWCRYSFSPAAGSFFVSRAIVTETGRAG